MSNQARNKQSSEFSISLNLTEPAKNDAGEWETTVTARVLFRPGNTAPNPSMEVVFQLTNREGTNVVGKVFTDEGSGNATNLINLGKAGSYIITAFLADEAGVCSVKQVPLIKEDKKNQKSGNLSVVVLGKRGKQILVISAATEDGTLISGINGKIFDGNKVKTFATDPDGTHTHKIKWGLEEKDRVIEVRIGNNPKQVWNGMLLGHKPEIQHNLELEWR